MAGRRRAARDPQSSSSRPHGRMTRASASQSESESATELPFIPSPRPSGSRNRGNAHRKTASFSTSVLQEEDEDTERTPRPPKRFRTQSTHSRRDSHSTAGRGGRRLGVRPSLAGAGVLQTTVDTRVDMVAGIAGDCLVSLLRLDGRGKGGKQREEEATRAFEVLRTSREMYLFSRDSSLFPLLSEMTSSLHPDVINAIDSRQLVNALALSNLATFVWVISQPDAAQELYRSRDVAATPAKGKGRARQDDELLGHVRRRNAILLKAWKEFWNVAVPRNKRSSETALELWLDFATIVYIFCQTPTIDPPADADESLPEIVQRIVDDLFSHSAVDRYGQWDLEEDGESQDEEERTGSEEKRIVDARWKKLVAQRRRMLDRSALDVSMRKFPYDGFRSRILAFVREEVLGQSDSALLQPSQSASLSAPYSPYGRSGQRYDEDMQESDDGLPDLKEETSMTQEDESDVPPEDEYEDVGGGEDEINWDLAADVLDELEREEEDFVRGAERLSLQSSPRKREAKTLSPARKKRRTSELEESGVRARYRSVEVPSFFGRKSKPVQPTFSFGRRQEDAEQIGWETQPRPRNSTPLGLSVRPSNDTPRARATSNHLPRHSMSRVDELRSAQDIFKRRDLTPTRSQLGSQGLLSADSIFRKAVKRFIPVAGIFSSAPAEQAIESEEEEGDESHAPSATEIDADEEDLLEDADVGVQEAAFESIQDALAVDAQMDSIAPSLAAPQRGGKKQAPTRPAVASEQPLESIDMNQDLSTIDDAPAAAFEQPAPPSSQHAYITSRPKTSRPDAFAAPEVDEDEEDRQLLLSRSPKTTTKTTPRTARAPRTPRTPQTPQTPRARATATAVKTEAYSPPRLLPRTPTPPIQDLPLSPPTSRPRTQPRPTATPRMHVGAHNATPGPSTARTPAVTTPRAAPAANTPRSAAATTTPRSTAPHIATPHSAPRPLYVPKPPPAARPPTQEEGVRGRAALEDGEDDPYMHDEDGEPLEADDTYVIPKDHVPVAPSQIHGQIDGQVSAYSRLAGNHRWTKEEELLLYRTLQKVPLSDPYPLRTVWHLHGEFGTLSDDLQMFNPQHMKDKMRVICDRRSNNNQPVEGRARFFLNKKDPRKQTFDDEAQKRKDEATAAARVEKERYVAEQTAKRAEEAAAKQASQQAKGKGKRKGKKKAQQTQDDLESEIEGDTQQDDREGVVEGDHGPSAEEDVEAPHTDPRGRTRSSHAASVDPPTPSRKQRHAHFDNVPNDRDARHAARLQRQAEEEDEEASAPRRGTRGKVKAPAKSGPGRPRKAAPQTPPRTTSRSATEPEATPSRNLRSSAAPPAPSNARGQHRARKSSNAATSTNLATGRTVRLEAARQAATNTAKGRQTRSRSRGNAVRHDSSDTPREGEDDEDGVEDAVEEQVDENQTQAAQNFVDRHLTEERLRRNRDIEKIVRG